MPLPDFLAEPLFYQFQQEFASPRPKLRKSIGERILLAYGLICCADTTYGWHTEICGDRIGE